MNRQRVLSRQTPTSASCAMPSCPRTASAQPRHPPAHLPTHRQTLTSPSFTVPCRLPAVHFVSARLPPQVVFPAETVQQSRERQAALLTGERLLEQLGEERGRSRALEQVQILGRVGLVGLDTVTPTGRTSCGALHHTLALNHPPTCWPGPADCLQENAALRQQVEGVVVQMLSVQADASLAQQSVAGLQQQLRAAQQERSALQAQAAAARRDLLLLQVRLCSQSCIAGL